MYCTRVEWSFPRRKEISNLQLRPVRNLFCLTLNDYGLSVMWLNCNSPVVGLELVLDWTYLRLKKTTQPSLSHKSGPKSVPRHTSLVRDDNITGPVHLHRT